MYKLLLVGDEKTTKNTLLQTIPWNNYGIGEVLEASDGVEALSVIKKQKPDIVLTDIKMPIIGGLELSSIVKKIYRRIIVVVMSSFEEYSLVKKALNIGAIDYLLKPIREEELMGVMQRSVECLNQDAENAKMENENIKNATALKNSLFASLINNCEDSESICRKLAELEIKLKFEDYFTAIFYLNEKSKEICKKAGFDMELLNFGLINIIEELCRGVALDYVVSTCFGFNIVLVVEGTKSESTQIKDLFDHIKNHIKEIFNFNIIIGMSRNYYNVDKMRDSYQEAYEHIERLCYCGYTGTKYIRNGVIKNEMFMEKKKDLIKSIYACDNAQAHEIIDWIFDMECRTGISVKQIKMLNVLLLNGLVSVANDIYSNIDEEFGNKDSIYNQLSQFRSLKKSKQFLTDIIDELIVSLTEHKTTIKNGQMESILAFVNENYNKDITLYTISEKFSMDYASLSKMFKENVGENFSKYLIGLKMSKAKELLRKTEMKVYEIGKHIGYNDIKYFTKIFKGLEGVTPLEYRKRIRHGRK